MMSFGFKTDTKDISTDPKIANLSYMEKNAKVPPKNNQFMNFEMMKIVWVLGEK